MAAPAASVSSWLPQDDLLLKNAVEAGASLEALAKGAVRFSRKFTIEELRERWHSLLYDPVISAEASAHMAEFELSASNSQTKSLRAGASMDNLGAPTKRKLESVQRLYYTFRKRTCIQPLNSPNLSISDPPNMSDAIRDTIAYQESVRLHHEGSVRSSMLGDCCQNRFQFQEMDLDFLHNGPEDNDLTKESIQHAIYEQKNVHVDSTHILGESLVDLENCPGIEGMGPSNALPDSDASFHTLGYSSPPSRTPFWQTIEDIPAPAMPINVSHGNEGQVSKETFILPDDMNEKRISSCVNQINPEIDYVDLSDSLLNLENEEELQFTDAAEKNSIDKSCHDNINPIVSSSPNDVHGDDFPNVKGPQPCLAIPGGSNLAELEVIAEQSHSVHGNQQSFFCSEVHMPSSTSVPNPLPHDFLDGAMECTLNSEDTDIPCNDDFVPGKVVASLAPQTSLKEASEPASFFGARKDSQQKLSKMRKEDCSAQCFTASHARGSDMFPGTSHPPFVTESTDVNCMASISRQANNVHAGLIQCRSVLAAHKSISRAGPRQELLHKSCATDVVLNAKSSATTNAFPEPEANPVTLDQEVLLDEEEYESDDDIPCFSDIESMILDLDLCPEDLNTCFSAEVSRYRHDYTKRNIIRLEQCARSSMQRAIAYQGALAVFYGRHMKHYIKETVVILGRATEDFDVDIDLGREGRANKISRRQALIKMEEDGSFILKNLGKSSIFVNGREIASGQGRSLSSNSLIEIRDMAFIFEINDENVKRYLANATRRNQEKNGKFEWAEAGLP